MNEKIGKVTLNLDYYEGQDFYSDGVIEEHLLELVKHHEPEEYQDIILKEKNWAVMYHLSQQRENILEWYPITKEDSVLEIGAGCGAISGVLAKKAGRVVANDLSKMRSSINAWKNKEAENLEIVVGNFNTVSDNLTETFDYVTLIGVFEYAKTYIQEEEPYRVFLDKINRHLKPNGKILMAIENKLGLKYFAGCKEDHVGRMFEGIEYRGYGQEIVEELAKYAGVPVWNGLTNEYHPTQMLADMLTVREQLGRLKGVKFVYMGDARYNMGNSLMIVCSKLGLHFVACAPKKYFPNPELVAQCEDYAKESGATITLTENVEEATRDADVICTDVWVSMGEPDEVWEERIRDLTPYKVTSAVMKNAGEKAIFLHCLPSFHDTNTTIGAEKCEQFGITEQEVTDEVFRSRHSVVFDEAENRMHSIKAVMVATIGA